MPRGHIAAQRSGVTKVRPIRIHPTDSEDAVRRRHLEIERRLEELGAKQVRVMLTHGALPTEWNVIAYAWLDGKRLGPPRG